jgi:PPOX class probable F420-dependent enzyme
MPEPILSPAERRLLAAARRAILATTDQAGQPRLVPICYVLSDDERTGSVVLHTPLDEKPKRTTDPHDLARVRDIAARPAVTILVDRWSEDWTELAWLRVHGDAVVLEADDPASADERSSAIEALRTKYRQYADQDLAARPLIRIVLASAVSWAASGD